MKAILIMIPLLVLAPSLAWGTADSSYRTGYSYGKSEWQSCAHTDGEGDCSSAHSMCADPIYHEWITLKATQISQNHVEFLDEVVE